MNAKLFVDGACPGNPGPGGAGVVILDSEGKTMHRESQFVGESVTNNFAEYSAMSLGLKRCFELDITNLEVFCDSKLMVGQLGFLGKPWKVKSSNLKELHAECLESLKRFETVKVTWIPREENRHADAAANDAIP